MERNQEVSKGFSVPDTLAGEALVLLARLGLGGGGCVDRGTILRGRQEGVSGGL